MTEHDATIPVSASAYSNHGCRCDGCKAEWSARQRDSISKRAANRAASQAAKWVRRNHPDVWERLVDEQYARLGVVRQPVGRPRA